MLPRYLTDAVPQLRKGYPIIIITGPRQSGKTTLAKMACPDFGYINLESPLEQADFRSDPIGYLDRFPDGAILDEVQHVPEITSYLQVRVDADGRMGRWVLTGSQQLELGRSISQSLAGRASMLELMPLSHAEIQASEACPQSLPEAVLKGGYPALYDTQRELDPQRWLEDYLITLIGRDIRQLLEVRDRGRFDTFLRLCAARCGQLINKAELASSCSIDNKTVDAWLSVLEACYIIRLVRPHFQNFGKRLSKQAKLHFIDTGLACRLLHLRTIDQLVLSPMYGGLVESWCVGEVYKSRLHRAQAPDCWFWRSSDGIEADLIIEDGNTLYPIEIKASQSAKPQDASNIRRLQALDGRNPSVRIGRGLLISASPEERRNDHIQMVPWNRIDTAIQELL